MDLMMYFSLCEKCPYSEFFWSVFSTTRTEYREILRKDICHEIEKRWKETTRERALNFEKHFPKTISQWEFDYDMFKKLPRIIAACDISPNSLKLKRGILDPLRK